MSVAALSRSPYASSSLSAALEAAGNQLVPGSPISPATAASLRLAVAAMPRSPVQFVPEVERSSNFTGSPLLRHVLKVQQVHAQPSHRSKRPSSPSPSERASKRACTNNRSPLVPVFLPQNEETCSPKNQDQVVPQCDKRSQRCLPMSPSENSEVLDLFHGDQIFASREE